MFPLHIRDIKLDKLPTEEELADILNYIYEEKVDYETQLLLAELYQNEGRTNEAIRVLKNAIESGVLADEETIKPFVFLLLALYIQTSQLGPAGEVVKQCGDGDIPIILKGYLMLRRKRYDAASFLFRKHVLGKAIAQMHMGDFEEAIRSSNGVIRGVGWYRQGNIEKAIELLSEYPKAYCYLYRINNANTESIDNNNIDISITNIESLINKGDYEIALSKLQKLDEIPYVIYLIGKIYHLKGELQEASLYYARSNNSLARYGLARINQDIELLPDHPKCKGILHLKAYLMLKKNRLDTIKTAALDDCILKTIIETKLNEKRWAYGALSGYHKLIGVPEVSQIVVYNNLAYYTRRCGKAGSDEYLKKALELCGEKWDNMKIPINFDKPFIIPLLYNMALVTQSEEILEALAMHDTRPEFLIHLGIIRNDIEPFKTISRTDKTSGLNLMGFYYLKNRSISMAKKHFEKVEGNNLYAMLSLGNIYLQYYRKESDENKRRISLNKALTYFTKALKKYPNCWYAAMGCGVVLAKKGYLDYAKRIFTDLSKEAKNESVFINLGNVLFEQGEYIQAIEAYFRARGGYAIERIIEVCEDDIVKRDVVIGWIDRALSRVRRGGVDKKKQDNREDFIQRLLYRKCQLLLACGKDISEFEGELKDELKYKLNANK
ncbi:RNA polymerase-associated protein CTR9 like protein [Astathelohania contejeani]|uniref:RNA polymerase-associated protein CTR9 like protein n=1 Tax=Astathelohania contejeani TaxID=164912 RepID=A0ABQ7HYC3_9MICR|nr:RNA polymerase-associated protein CTR9 like protein [Thelohania contejeani]